VLICLEVCVPSEISGHSNTVIPVYRDISPAFRCKQLSSHSTRFGLFWIVVDLLCKTIHNNPQQIEQAEFELYSTIVALIGPSLKSHRVHETSCPIVRSSSKCKSQQKTSTGSKGKRYSSKVSIDNG